jgi:hypothetical protein
MNRRDIAFRLVTRSKIPWRSLTYQYVVVRGCNLQLDLSNVGKTTDTKSIVLPMSPRRNWRTLASESKHAVPVTHLAVKSNLWQRPVIFLDQRNIGQDTERGPVRRSTWPAIRTTWSLGCGRASRKACDAALRLMFMGCCVLGVVNILLTLCVAEGEPSGPAILVGAFLQSFSASAKSYFH